MRRVRSWDNTDTQDEVKVTMSDKAKTKTIIIGNDKGGVGKDLVAEGILSLIRGQGYSCQLIEIESEERLKKKYPETHFIAAPALAVDDLYAKPDAIFERFDDMATATAKSDVNIVCLGANLTGMLLQWGRDGGTWTLLSRTDPIFCSVLTMNQAALDTGIKNLTDAATVFRGCARFAVLNEYAAEFVQGDRMLLRLLRGARGEGDRIHTVRIPRNTAPGWGHIQNCGTLPETAEMDHSVLTKRGLPEGVAIRSMIIFRKWFHDQFIPALNPISQIALGTQDELENTSPETGDEQ